MSQIAWKKHVNSCFGCVSPGEAEHEQFTRSWTKNLSPLVWRIPILLWALTVAIWSMLSFWGPPEMFLLYMTHWGLILIVLEMIVGIFVTVKRPYGQFKGKFCVLVPYKKPIPKSL